MPDNIEDIREGGLPGVYGNGDLYLSSNETVRWSLGDLQPGQAYSLTLPIDPDDGDGRGEATGTSYRLTATAGSESSSWRMVHRNSSEIEFDIVEPSDAASPGGEVSFSILFVNRLLSATPAFTIRQSIPRGTSFLSATKGGAVDDGEIVWTIPALEPREGGRVTARFAVDPTLPSGTIITTEAEADLGEDGLGARGRTSHVVRSESDPLRAFVGVEQSRLYDGSLERFTYTVSNAGTSAIPGVVAAILIPDNTETTRSEGLPGVYANGDLRVSANETVEWSIGDLQPGEARSLVLPFRSAGELSNRVRNLRSTMNAYSSGAPYSARATGQVGIDLLTEVETVLSSASPPPTPGGSVDFALDFSSSAIDDISNLTLRMPVPAGTAFRAASSGGTLDGDTLVWRLGRFTSDQGGRVIASFDVDPSLNPGTLITAIVEAEPGTPLRPIHAEASTSVRASGGLDLSVNVPDRTIESGTSTTYILTASNGGTSALRDVVAAVLMPNAIETIRQGGLPGIYGNGDLRLSANETVEWEVGDLGPGETRTIALPISPGQFVSDKGIFSLSVYPVSGGPGQSHHVAVGTATGTELRYTSAESEVDAGTVTVRSFPSPFSTTTTLETNLDATQHVVAEVFDAMGRLVATLHDGPLPAGTSTLHWRAEGLASGLYLYRVATPVGVASGTVLKVSR